MKRLDRTLFAAALVAILVGCASNDDPADGPIVASNEPANVEVTNNNWLDMAIYAISGGKRVRLGMVTTMSKERFEVPRTLLSTAANLQLSANPIGAPNSFTTPSLNVWPGQTVEFRIENQIGISNVSIR